MIEVQDLSPWLLLVAPVIVIVGYTVFGLSGFGATAITVPVLAHFLPVIYLVPMVALLDLVSSTFVHASNRQEVSKAEIKWLLLPMFAGFVVGVTVLVQMPDNYVRGALGVFIIAIGVNGIVNPVLHRVVSRWWSVPAGIVGGAAATVFGAGGPIYATYLSGRLQGKGEIRSTLAALISISAFSRAIVYAVSGVLLHLAIFAGALALAPFVWVGLKAGARIHVGLTQVQMRRAIGGVLLFTGGSLLARALTA
jgi:uncharacterized membrane protein YfcA